jgi:CrcB protein
MSDDTTPLLGRLEAVVLVAIGGFAGSNLRYVADLLVPGLAATLLVNTLGSLALGAVVSEATRVGVLADETRTVVATGFLSSFTTYSTFAVQSVQAGPIWLVANVLLTYTFGFAGVLAGRALVRTTGQRWGAW